MVECYLILLLCQSAGRLVFSVVYCRSRGGVRPVGVASAVRGCTSHHHRAPPIAAPTVFIPAGVGVLAMLDLI